MHHAFLSISEPSLHDYDVKVPNFTFFLRTVTQDDNFVFLFFNFDEVLQNSNPKKLPTFDESTKMEQARKSLRQSEFTF